jgi:hypothetical protein
MSACMMFEMLIHLLMVTATIAFVYQNLHYAVSKCTSKRIPSTLHSAVPSLTWFTSVGFGHGLSQLKLTTPRKQSQTIAEPAE